MGVEVVVEEHHPRNILRLLLLLAVVVEPQEHHLMVGIQDIPEVLRPEARVHPDIPMDPPHRHKRVMIIRCNECKNYKNHSCVKKRKNAKRYDAN